MGKNCPCQKAGKTIYFGLLKNKWLSFCVYYLKLVKMLLHACKTNKREIMSNTYSQHLLVWVTTDWPKTIVAWLFRKNEPTLQVCLKNLFSSLLGWFCDTFHYNCVKTENVRLKTLDNNIRNMNKTCLENLKVVHQLKVQANARSFYIMYWTDAKPFWWVRNGEQSMLFRCSSPWTTYCSWPTFTSVPESQTWGKIRCSHQRTDNASPLSKSCDHAFSDCSTNHSCLFQA